jgi:acetyl-CoA acetyltransferase family protein
VNDGKWVKDVVKIEGGFKITFNNGDAYDIVNGKNGVTHKVEIKEGYWYIDNVKQIAATGPTGPQGPAGPEVPKGPAGVDGKSPYIGADGFWYFYQPKHENAIKEGDKAGWVQGPTSLVDGMQKDGLTDAYDNNAMGVCADLCASEHQISREAQDQFAIQSYERSAAAWEAGKFDAEIVPVEVPQRKGEPILVTKDEEYTNVKLDRIPALPAVFTKDGTVTAANASTINDGAAALVLMSEEKANELGLKPLAYITSYADAAQEPKWFTTAPAKALPKALDKAGLSISDIDFFEFNEAFSVVGLANAKILGLDNDKINVNGGAVSLGHPLGCSGTRIIVTLINVLEQNNAKYGAAAICNGGGGASAIVIEKA